MYLWTMQVRLKYLAYPWEPIHLKLNQAFIKGRYNWDVTILPILAC